MGLSPWEDNLCIHLVHSQKQELKKLRRVKPSLGDAGSTLSTQMFIDSTGASWRHGISLEQSSILSIMNPGVAAKPFPPLHTSASWLESQAQWEIPPPQCHKQEMKENSAAMYHSADTHPPSALLRGTLIRLLSEYLRSGLKKREKRRRESEMRRGIRLSHLIMCI